MSRKKNRNRNQSASLNVKDEKTLTEDNKVVSDDSSVSDYFSSKNRMIAHLKAHWRAVGLIALFSLGAFGAGWKYLEENARQTAEQREKATPLNPSQEGLLSKVNPLVPAASPSPTPQLSKEYIAECGASGTARTERREISNGDKPEICPLPLSTEGKSLNS